MQMPIDYPLPPVEGEQSEGHGLTLDQLHQRTAAGLPVTEDMIRSARHRIYCAADDAETKAQHDAWFNRLSRQLLSLTPRD